MRVARYIGGGRITISEEPAPICPPGGLLVQTEACGLCSGELMAWYMDRKVPHVLGHEVSGVVLESLSDKFSVGDHVFPHHHAPCLHCELCARELYVHCAQWKRTKLVPGGMADLFAVSAENLSDTHLVNDLRPPDAALVEPLACVVKSLRLAGRPEPSAVVGLGAMGLLHLLSLPTGSVGYELSEDRRQWANDLGLDAREPGQAQPASTIFVCPGSQKAFDFALKLATPGATIVMFAPVGPGESLHIPQSAYFADLTVVHSYSCSIPESLAALEIIRAGAIKAEQICSDFIGLDMLPDAYQRMKAGQILKPIVLF